MEPNEPVKIFFDQFLHLCYEIPEEDMNWEFLKQEFEHLVVTASCGEPEPPNFFTSPTLVYHETPLISKEEFTVHFFLFPPPFPVLIGVPLCDGNKVKKYANQTPNPSSHSSPTFHDSDSLEKIPEWLMSHCS